MAPYLSREESKIESLFQKINETVFNGELETPVITIASTKRHALGWCTVHRVWGSGKPPKRSDLEGLSDEETVEALKDFVEGGYFEINLVPEILTEGTEFVAEILIHEACHLLNIMHGVQDCSRNGSYHNKRFKETAEAHGLIVQKTKKYGWSETSLAPETKKFIDGLDIEEIGIYRKGEVGTGRVVNNDEDSDDEEKPKQSSRKLVCPCCGGVARVTKAGFRIKCFACDIEMETV